MGKPKCGGAIRETRIPPVGQKEIFKDSSEADIDPSKCAVFSVAKKKEIHDEIRKCGIEKIFVKTEMKRTKLMEIIESVIGSDDHDK